MPSNTSLYGSSANSSNVGSNNFTTLYSPGAGVVRTQLPYGNANVVSLLNIGTDGGNTITNIIATGNITANNFIGNFIGNSTNANFANYAGNAFSVNVANVVGIGNIATINLDGNVSNILHGDGSFGPEAGNLTANYANFAGNVTIGNQPNITAVGNLIQLDVIDSNTSYSPVVSMNFRTNNFPPVGRTGITFDIYANEANGEFARTETYVKHRGNIANPTSAGVGDFVQRSVSSIFDGANTARIAQFQTIVSNIVPGVVENGWVGGSYNFNTGNPYGNGSYIANDSSGFNSFSMNDIGAITTRQGNRPDTGLQAQYTSTSYGRSSANPNIAAGMNFLRADGNSEANLSVQPNYEIYRIGAVPYNGTAFSAGSANGFSIAAITGNAYVANNANVPIDFRIRVVDSNNFASNSWFYNDGTVSLANNTTVNGNLTVTDQTNLGNVGNVHITGGSANFVLITDGVGNLNWANASNASVANANYANFANVANVANSVAVGNVVGIGNIATINLDGSSSNVLFGNGVFAPESTSIANANYANFAGNLINGTSNITIPTASSNIFISTAGNANIVDIYASGTVNLKPPAQGPLNALRIDTYGRSGNQGAQRISSFRFRGNSTTPLSVQPNDATMELLTVAYNGSIIQTSSIGRIQSLVDNSYVANAANIPIGWNIQVNDTNGGINNQTKNHYFYSNGNVVFANTVFATDNLVAGGNITSNIGTFIGNGAGLTNLTGANVTGTVANATYADNAGNASAIGNIANLNIISSNTSLPTDQFNTTGIVVGSTANANLQANSLQVVVDYGNGQGDSNSALTKGISYVKARGTSASPTTAVANDIIKRENYLGYNGASNVLYATTTANATTINVNANAVWGSGSYQINTGGVNGDLGNANALSAYNSFNFLSTGQLQIIPGANSAPGGLISIVSYGQPTSLSQGQGITMSKARGNRDANASVQANDTLGRIVFQGHNGNAFVTNRLPIIRSVVDSTYTTGNANIPAGITMVVCDSNTNYTHNFYSNGATVLSGNLNAAGGNFSVDKTTGGATSLYFGGDKTTNSSFNMFDTQFSVTMSNVNTTTGFSPFRFQQYAPTNSEFGPIYMYRARGTDFFNQGNVVANDQIMSLNFLVNSNNTTTSVGQFNSTVTYNDNAGNVGSKLDFNAVGSGTTGYLNGVINLLANTTNANNFNASNVQLNRFQETVYSIGSTSGTITPDFNNGSIQNMTLTGNITMNTLGNAIGGRSMTLILTVGGTGSYTLTSSMKFLNGYKTLSSGVGAIDIITVFYDGGTYYASLTNGYS
tara:strand:+ start:4044 stop:7913 length:3870 start_codon:yes stop_codon:yes gene_type:complete